MLVRIRRAQKALMKLRAWWRRRPLRPVPDGGEPKGDTAELVRLELLAEQAYAAMYDVPPLRSVKDDYDNARLFSGRSTRRSAWGYRTKSRA
jgi:hypothetical protein